MLPHPSKLYKRHKLGFGIDFNGLLEQEVANLDSTRKVDSRIKVVLLKGFQIILLCLTQEYINN